MENESQSISQNGMQAYPSFSSSITGAISVTVQGSRIQASDRKNASQINNNSNSSNNSHYNEEDNFIEALSVTADNINNPNMHTPIPTRNRVNTALDLPLPQVNFNFNSQESSPTCSVLDTSKLPVQWLRVECPGQKVKIRPSPNVSDTSVGMIFSGEEVEVYIKLVSGFLQLVDGRVCNKPWAYIYILLIQLYFIIYCIYSCYL